MEDTEIISKQILQIKQSEYLLKIPTGWILIRWLFTKLGELNLRSINTNPISTKEEDLNPGIQHPNKWLDNATSSNCDIPILARGMLKKMI